MKQLDPKAKVLFYINGFFACLFIFGFCIIPISVAFTELIGIGAVFLAIFLVLIISALVPLPWAYLSYENYKYQLQKERIDIEKGVIWKKYVSIPYERIQNVDILRGPIARMLNLSDLQIQTAGSSTQMLVEGRIQAVSVQDANALKEEILSKVSISKKQGL